MVMSGLPPGWEDDYDGRQWVYRYKPTGLTQTKFPQEGDEFPEHVASYGMFDLAPEERLASEQQVRRRSGADGAQSAPRSTNSGPISKPLETVGEMSATGYFDPSSYYYDEYNSSGEEEIATKQVEKQSTEQNYVVSPDAATPSSAPIPRTAEAEMDAGAPAVSSHNTGVSAASHDGNTVASRPEETDLHMLDGQSLPAELSAAVSVSAAADGWSPVGYVPELATSDTLKCADELAPVELDASENPVELSATRTNVSHPIELPTDASPRKGKQTEPRRASAPLAPVESYPLTSASFSYPPLKNGTAASQVASAAPPAPSNAYQTWDPARQSTKIDSGRGKRLFHGSPEISVIQSQENDLATEESHRKSVVGDLSTSGKLWGHPTILTPQPGPPIAASPPLRSSNDHRPQSPVPAILKPAQGDTRKQTAQQSISTTTTFQIPGAKARHESISNGSYRPSTADQKESALSHVPSVLKPARNRQSMLASLHEQREWHTQPAAANTKGGSFSNIHHQSDAVMPTDGISELSAASRVPAFLCITAHGNNENTGRPPTQRVQTAPQSLPSQEVQRPTLSGPGLYVFQEIPSSRQRIEDSHIPDGKHRRSDSEAPSKVDHNVAGSKVPIPQAGVKPSIVAVPKVDATSSGKHGMSNPPNHPHKDSPSKPPKEHNQPHNLQAEQETNEQSMTGADPSSGPSSGMNYALTTIAPLTDSKPPGTVAQTAQSPTHTGTTSHHGLTNNHSTIPVHTSASSLADGTKPSGANNYSGSAANAIHRPSGLAGSPSATEHSHGPSHETSASFSHQNPTLITSGHVISDSASAKPSTEPAASGGKINETSSSVSKPEFEPFTSHIARPPSLPSQVSSPSPSIPSAHQTPSSTFSQLGGTIVELSPPDTNPKPPLPLKPASVPLQQTVPSNSNTWANKPSQTVSQLQALANGNPQLTYHLQHTPPSVDPTHSSPFQPFLSQAGPGSQPWGSQSIHKPSALISSSSSQQQQQPLISTSQAGALQAQTSGHLASGGAQGHGGSSHASQFSSTTNPHISSTNLPSGGPYTTPQVSTQVHIRPPQAHAQYQPQQFSHHQAQAQPVHTQHSHSQKPHTQQLHGQHPHGQHPHGQAPHTQHFHPQKPHAQQSHAQNAHGQNPQAQHPHTQHPSPQKPYTQHPHNHQGQSFAPQKPNTQQHSTQSSQPSPGPTTTTTATQAPAPIKPSTANSVLPQQSQNNIPASIDTAAVLAHHGKEIKGWFKRVVKNPALRQTTAAVGGALASEMLGGDAMSGAMLANRIYETNQSQPGGGAAAGGAGVGGGGRPPGPVHAQTAPPQAPGLPGPRPPVQVVSQPAPGVTQPIGVQTPGRPFAVQNPAMAGAPVVQVVQQPGPPRPGQQPATAQQPQLQWQQNASVQMQYNNQQALNNNNNISFSANFNDSPAAPTPQGGPTVMMSEQTPVQIQNTVVIDNSTSDSYFAPQQPGGIDVTNVYVDNSITSNNAQTISGSGDGTSSYYTDNNTYVNEANSNIQASDTAEATYYTENSNTTNNTYTNDTTYVDSTYNNNSYVNDTTYGDSTYNNNNNTYVNDTTYTDTTYTNDVSNNTYTNDTAYVDAAWADTTDVNVNVDMSVNVEVDQSYMAAAGQDVSYASYSTDVVATESVTEWSSASVDYSGGDWGGEW